MSKTTAVILHFTSALLGLLSIGMFLILNTHITVWLLIAVDSIPALICGTVSGILQIRIPKIPTAASYKKYPICCFPSIHL